MATYVNYMNDTLNFLWEYIHNLSEYEKIYNHAKFELSNKSTITVKESYSALQHEIKISEAYRTANTLYNELCNIAEKYRNGMDVELELQNFNHKLNK